MSDNCSNCVADNGIFDMLLSCCRKRHYQMTLRIDAGHAHSELSGIRAKYGSEEADILAMIPPPKYSANANLVAKEKVNRNFFDSNKAKKISASLF
jgi:hypothetical protein